MTLGFRVPVFGQNFLYLKLESEIRTTETGRVVLACAFLKHDRFSKLSTLITLTLCKSGSEFRVRGRRRDVEIVAGAWACGRSVALPFLIMGSQRSLPSRHSVYSRDKDMTCPCACVSAYVSINVSSL